MHRNDHPTAAAVLPAPAAAGTPGYFTRGNPNSGTPATVPTADWANAVQEEPCGVIEAAGIALDKINPAQLLTALHKLFGGGGSLGANGWQKLPGALILQWGSGITATGWGDAVTFPTAFPTTIRSVVANEGAGSGWGASSPKIYGTGLGDTPNAGFKIFAMSWNGSAWAPAGGLTYSWLAVGY